MILSDIVSWSSEFTQDEQEENIERERERERT